MTTFWESAVSPRVKSRPVTRGIPIASKYPVPTVLTWTRMRPVVVVSAPSGKTLRARPPASGGARAIAAPFTPGSPAVRSTIWS